MQIFNGDCLQVLPTLAENSIDAAVCDPPYHLTSAKQTAYQNTTSLDTPHRRGQKGFMGQEWDGGDISFRPETWKELYRVLKPGAHALVFGGTRGHHRIWCALEDAGFELRDTICWTYGSGFAKSRNIGNDIAKIRGETGELVGSREQTGFGMADVDHNRQVFEHPHYNYPENEWTGWGIAVRPAYEPIVLCRKPLSEKTIAQNVLKHRTGALNIAACQIAGDRVRLPSNFIHDGSASVLEALGEKAKFFQSCEYNELDYIDRIAYCAKASRLDRAGSGHPTIKPVKLLEYLCKLITPPGGTIIDPFAGSGSTGQAAVNCGFDCILVEKEVEYYNDICRRLALFA